MVRDDELFADPRSGESIDLSSSASWLGTAPDPIKDQTDFLAQLDLIKWKKLCFLSDIFAKNKCAKSH